MYQKERQRLVQRPGTNILASLKKRMPPLWPPAGPPMETPNSDIIKVRLIFEALYTISKQIELENPGCSVFEENLKNFYLYLFSLSYSISGFVQSRGYYLDLKSWFGYPDNVLVFTCTQLINKLLRFWKPYQQGLSSSICWKIMNLWTQLLIIQGISRQLSFKELTYLSLLIS